MLLRRHMKNLRKPAQLEISKNRGELEWREKLFWTIAKSKNWKNGENSRNFKIKSLGSRECLWRRINFVFRKSGWNQPVSIGNNPKTEGNCERYVKRLTKILILILMTKIWTKNRKFDKVTTFEPEEILTRCKRWFVHLGEVNTLTKS